MWSDDAYTVVGLAPVFEQHGVDLLVLVERAYELRGRSLLPMPVPEPFHGCEWSDTVFRDPLIVPEKTATDFVLSGHVHGGGGRSTLVEVEVGRARVVADVMGDRIARATERGWTFADPEPFDEMLIHPNRAYGGIDPEVEYVPRQGPDGHLDAFAQEMTDAPVGVYPRNPKGRGYVVGARIGREVALPNFELADDRLTPERLGCPSQAEWWRMPRPAALGWQPFDAFPRSAYAVLDDDWAAVDDRLLVETRLGQVPQGWLRARAGRMAPLAPRFWNGAHPDLCMTLLSGDEPIRIRGARPGRPLEVAVPGPGPIVDVRIAGCGARARGDLWTLELDLDTGRLDCVWAARFPQPAGDGRWSAAFLGSGEHEGLRLAVGGEIAEPEWLVEIPDRPRVAWTTDAGTVELG